MSTQQKPPEFVSHRRLAATLARNFNISYSALVRFNIDVDERRYFETPRLVCRILDNETTWIFILLQRNVEELQVLHSFKCTPTQLQHVKLLCRNGTKVDPEITHITQFVEPFMLPVADPELTEMYTTALDEFTIRRLARNDTFYASSTLREVERPEDQDDVSIFFKSENTTFGRRHYKILLMRVRNQQSNRDDLVVAIFYAELQDGQSMASPVFKDAMRLYHKREHTALMRLLEEPGNPWVYLYNVYEYPEEQHCLCWTSPKIKASDDSDYQYDYDERFKPSEIYVVHRTHRREDGSIESLDVVAHDGTIVNHRLHHFIVFPGKDEHVRID